MYKTGTMLPPQKVRRQLGQVAFYENDVDVGFQLTNIATALGAEGTDYALYSALGNHAVLLNCLCGVNSIHSEDADRYIVPSTFFNATNYTDEAGATAAFLASFRGVNLTAPAAGEYEKVNIATHCEVEYFAVAGTYVAGTLLTVVWDGTLELILPWTLQATTDPTVAVARVVESTPLLPKTGNQTRVRAMIQFGTLPLVEAPAP